MATGKEFCCGATVRASKKRHYELNSDEKRASKRESLAREFGTNGTAANVTEL